VRALVVSLLLLSAVAHADDKRPIVGFKVKGDSKVTDTTLGYLAHLHVGDLVGPDDLGQLQIALISSELFTTASVALEPAPGGYVFVATVDDKLSWIVGPTVYFLPSNRAFGVGYAENDFRGHDQKFLLYGQLGTKTSIFFATFLDPSFHGTPLQWRADVYLERRQIDEYANPSGMPTNFDVARTTEQTFLDAGMLVGWQFKWWLIADARLRAAYVIFHDALDPRTNTPVAKPENDGWDATLQTRLTLDHRIHSYGVTAGPYAQLQLEPSVPGWDSYGYFNSQLRAYYSWVFLCEHELELRSISQLGYHLPIHEDNALGGGTDLRGYGLDQFRGDLVSVFRAEYSVPLFKWWLFKFRGLGFYDTGVSRFEFPRADRNYLPGQLDRTFFRNDVGIGLRAYVKAVVLPLLGIDLGYGIEGHSPEVYFELGLTDF
jgi:outer membrane protein insertion porin family